MKLYQYLLILTISVISIPSAGQTNSSADTSVSFKVSGVCEQCKERIEEAVKSRGVRSANWDIHTKLLSLVYNRSQTTLDKLQNSIVDAGHDLETKKSKDRVYNQLPKCCRYRTMESMVEGGLHKSAIDTSQPIIPGLVKDSILRTPPAASNTVSGVVLESTNKGDFSPLQGATIHWLGTTNGVFADSAGVFHIQHDGTSSRLVVSYTGYKADTIAVTDFKELKIILATGNHLGEVVVTSKQRSTYLSASNPIRTQIMTDKELFKAACCNLSESFETNPSVDVSYNDAVTGSKQIQLLGLSGNYTQLTVENLPGPRGIATPLGLNSVAGPWVESIQLTKGIGSVANGYESIAGQINVELKKPESSEKMYVNAYINDYGKTDLNLNLSGKLGKKWSAGLLLHDDFIANKQLDFNKDGFRDLPTGNQFSLVNRYKYDDGKGFLTQFGIKILNDKRTGGETAFITDVDKNTTNHYGLGINTERYEAFAKIGYVFPAKKYQSIGLQISAIDHKQDSYFGLTTYNAKQQNFYANLIYQSIINNTAHKFRSGLSFLSDKYDEDFKAINYNRKEIVPGAFFEYTFTPSEKFSAIAGLRADYNNLYGFFVTPRLHVKYEPVKGTIIRVSAGRGQRTANIFAENTSVFVSSRVLNIVANQTGKAYGLNAETAWNKGISLDQKFNLFSRVATMSLDYYRNDFDNQVVVDLEDSRQVKFYNLQGKSYSNSIQAELNIEPVSKLNVRVAYRYFDVKSTYSRKLLERPLIAANRGFANLEYAIKGWKFDYTLNLNGRKRIPGTTANPVGYKLENYSPAFIIMNTQVSKSIGKKSPVDLYFGVENLTGYFQKNVIISADQPFNSYFDASMVWGPVTGRMFYTGFRFKIK